MRESVRRWSMHHHLDRQRGLRGRFLRRCRCWGQGRCCLRRRDRGMRGGLGRTLFRSLGLCKWMGWLLWLCLGSFAVVADFAAEEMQKGRIGIYISGRDVRVQGQRGRIRILMMSGHGCCLSWVFVWFEARPDKYDVEKGLEAAPSCGAWMVTADPLGKEPGSNRSGGLLAQGEKPCNIDCIFGKCKVRKVGQVKREFVQVGSGPRK